MVFVPSGSGDDPFDVPDPDITRPLDPNGRDVQAAPGMVRIAPANAALAARTDLAVILINMDDPERGGGAGGWQTVERPFRRPVKWWQAPELSTMTLHCAIDRTAIAQRLSVEHAIERLYSIAADPSSELTGSAGSGGASDDPTPIRLSGDVMARDTRIDWVIQDIALGERLWARGFGFPVLQRQLVDVTLEEYVPAPTIEAVKVQRTRPTSGSRSKHTITTKQGDTLRAIAVRELGDPDDWTKVRDWNPALKKVHPDDPLATGTKVTIGGQAPKK
jgi:nucleoid-associated protein YgaU